MPRSLRLLAVAGLSVVLMNGVVAGQQGQQDESPAPAVINRSDDPILRAFRFRSIGPAVMGGRVNDVEGDPNDPMTLYVAFATSGLWKTENGGITWTSLFDEMPFTSIGDVGIAPSNGDIVYVGMGEANNRQSSSIGNGMYKTIDGGKTWTHLGLDDTQSISRVVVHPTNPDIVFVAAMGHLYAGNEERGLFKTTDGGKTWTKSKYIDQYTGFADVAIDPVNPNNVYATSYQRLRTWWGYNGGGPGSGLWKSTDGGTTWTRLTGNGLPEPEDGIWGRSGIGIHRANPSIIYAIIEAGATGGTGANVADDGGPIQPGRRGGGAAKPDPNKSGVWRSNDAGKTWTYLSNVNNRPMYYSQIVVHPENPDIVVQGGATAMRSVDGGKTWIPFRGTGHGDYHGFWFNPKDPRVLWTGHDGGLDVSYDTGLTWDYHNNMAHGQFYQVSADMRRPYHVCGGLQDNGSWCGPSAVRSSLGPINTDWYRTGGGDGFYTRQDPTDWTVIYTESQNGFLNRLDLRNGTSKMIRPRLPRDNGDSGRGGGPSAGNIINPKEEVDLRFNWNAPIEMSPHDPSTIFYGAQFFFKSTDRGDTWWMNPTDLTNAVDRFAHPIMGVKGDAPMASKHDGYQNNSNITIIRESPVRRGVIWVGTDDGNLHVSTDEGLTFTNVIGNITGGPRVTGPMTQVQISRAEPSNFDAGTAFVSLDNHRNNDWKPYLFKTTDFGKTWTSISGNLPAMGHINAVEQDHVNPDLIFVGTEFGLYVTLDGGQTYKPFSNGMPRVRVDDLLIHPRDNDLIVGTHGRSIWIADDISPLQQLRRVGSAKAAAFDTRPAILWKNDTTQGRAVPQKQFRGENPQGGTAISFWTREADEDAKIEILDERGETIRTIEVDAKAGLNRVQWDLRPDAPSAGATGGQAAAAAAAAARFARRSAGSGATVPFVTMGGRGAGPVAPGAYMVRITVGGETLHTSVPVLEDVWMGR